jgi:hypothetical protein
LKTKLIVDICSKLRLVNHGSKLCGV